MVFAPQVNAFLIQAAIVMVDISEGVGTFSEGKTKQNDVYQNYENCPQYTKRSSFLKLQRGRNVPAWFVGQHYLVDEPQGADFVEFLEQLYETQRLGLNAHSSPSKKSR